MDVSAVLQRSLAVLTKERTRILAQIEAIETAIAATTQTGRRAKRRVARRRRTFSQRERRAISRRMKAYWAAKRRSKAA